MGNEIYGLNYDFINQQGVLLTFTKDQWIHSNEMIDVQVKMLHANPVPHLLPIQIEEIDFQVKLQYNISSKKLLHHVLKGRKITLDEFYRILYKIVSILEDGKIYMLSETNYILKEDFIYIGRDITDLYLTYLPLQNLSKKETLKDDLRNLAMFLIGHVDRLRGEAFQQITYYFKEEIFSISEFKKMLKKRIEQVEIQDPIRFPKEQLNRSSIGRVEEKENIPQKISSRSRTFILLGAIVSLAIIWRLYLFFGSEGFLFISLGLSLFVIDAVYILFTVWQPSKIRSKKMGEPKMKQIDNEPKKPSRMNSHDHQRLNNNYYKNLQNQTRLLKESDRTEFLEESTAHSNIEKSEKAYLEVQRKGRLEKIRITEKRFVIGRNPSTVDYVEDVRGVSRAHAEVISEGNQYKLVDLGSSNGTYLNQHQLVPNKEYIVEDGDSIKISKTEFLFKRG